jgi:acyl-CoA reductase-like NAD-dependent aldehyde dehydrogenase
MKRIEQGAQLICGGKRNGSYVEPTILTNCNHTMKVYAEEVFGPVICINSYKTLKMQYNKQTIQNLVCSVVSLQTILMN